MPEKFENATFTGHFGSVFKKLCHRNPNYHEVILFKKGRFRDGLVWAARPVVKIKLCFQISPEWSVAGPNQVEIIFVADRTVRRKAIIISYRQIAFWN